MRSLVVIVALAASAARAQEPLTLDAALAEAERASPDLAQSRARLEQARAAVGRARAGHLPQVRAQGTYTRNSDEVTLALPGISATIQERDQLGAQLDLTQAIFAPRLWWAVSGAKAGARAAEETAEAARRELRLGVAQAYYGASSAAQAVAIQERQLATAQAHERDARVQVEAGVAARITLLRAGVERARAEQDLGRARNQLASARSALAALLGRSEAVGEPLAAPPPPGLPADLAGLEGEALRRRPELRAAGEAVAAADAGRKAANARYLPTLGGFGQARWTSSAGLAGKEESWAAGLALSWDLLDGGLREADRREARGRLAEAEASRAGVANKALDEVRRARLDLESARANRTKAEEQAALARENQRLVEASFRAGASTSLEATDANAALATSELAVVTEGLASDLAALRLLRAAGVDR